MTDRISSFQSGPATTFYLEADVVETDASWGTNGRWRIRFYLRAKNGPGGSTSSAYNGSGRQTAVSNATDVMSHTANPFLPAGFSDNQTRYKDGPVDSYRTANSNGYWTGTSTALNVYMELVYGSVNVRPSGTVPLPRIKRAPGAAGVPVASGITSTAATLTWTAAERGNADIDRYQWRVADNAGMSGALLGPELAGTTLTDSTANDVTLTPGVTYYAQARARNADGWGPWSASSAGFQTVAGVFVSDGTAWTPREMFTSDGRQWLAAAVNVSDGTSWKPAG
jgi:hypothetical protein